MCVSSISLLLSLFSFDMSFNREFSLSFVVPRVATSQDKGRDMALGFASVLTVKFSGVRRVHLELFSQRFASIATSFIRGGQETHTDTDVCLELTKSLIRQLYGEAILQKVNSFSKSRKSVQQHLCILTFLKRCRDRSIVPRFLEIKHTITTSKSKRILEHTSFGLLRERIGYIKKEISRISNKLLHLELSIHINPELWNKVDRLSYEQALRVHTIRTQKQKEKFYKLLKPKTQVEPLKNTVKNLTDLPLSSDALSVLAKGHNFAIAPKTIPTEEIISQVENVIYNLPPEMANEVRRLTINALKLAKTPKSNLTKAERKALLELKQRKDILILPADKGNMTVIINKDEYIDKVHNLLNDETYRTITKDPTKSVARITTTVIKQAKLPDHIQKTILPREPKAPRLYGLAKIHKPDIPLRPIVGTLGSPTYNLAKYLTTILKPLTGDILGSFDVQSLFTNVPIDDSIDIIKDKMPVNLIPLVHHYLISTYFLFQGTYYEQVSGAAMGSPISPVIADIFMEHLEDRILKGAPLKPSQWFRYVDDTFVVWSHGKDTLNNFLKYINSLHPKIQFTMETETEEQTIPFLDVLVTRKPDGTLGHQVYRKPTHTNRCLPASSHHHSVQKNSVLSSLIHRAINICEEEHLPEELNHIRNTLQQNGFSKNKINRTIDRILHPTDRPSTSDNKEKQNTTFLPYIQGTTDRIGRILRKHKIRTIFTTHTKIKQVLPPPRTRNHSYHQRGFTICTCGKVYIGETGRSMSTRLKEHERCTRLGYLQSAVAEHQKATGHKILFNEAKVIAKTKGYFPRKYRETLEITKHPNNINRDTGHT
ncbi:LOW QUALITY PROTEIN: uncharacterized protein LOC143187549 [Calliopsis andreniformis]|uniref:LOW QUALITY PROTEIN: uncharacterized protein LOC143187549 n=1 Tax=Calliopsis andreniformis TaxID=337506 RepID=UPI003FCC6816